MRLCLDPEVLLWSIWACIKFSQLLKFLRMDEICWFHVQIAWSIVDDLSCFKFHDVAECFTFCLQLESCYLAKNWPSYRALKVACETKLLGFHEEDEVDFRLTEAFTELLVYNRCNRSHILFSFNWFPWFNFHIKTFLKIMKKFMELWNIISDFL